MTAAIEQVERVMIALAKDATKGHPDNVEQRAMAFVAMLCGALEVLSAPGAAAEIRTMVGVRRPAGGA